MSVSGSGPAARTGVRRFTVVVRNLGAAATTGDAVVTLRPSNGWGRTVAATGEGWSCDPPNAVCRTDRSVAPGEEAPAIVVETAGAPLITSGGTEGLAATVSGGGVDRVPENDTSSASVALVNGTGVDLVPSVEDAGPVPDVDGPGSFLVRVRNVGAAETHGTVAVLLSRGTGAADEGVVASGDGWSCPERAGRCSTEAGADPGAELPPLNVTVPAPPSDAGGLRSLTARVSGGNDGDDRDDEASGSRIAGRPVPARDLTVSLRDVHPAATGDVATFDAVTTNTATTDRSEPTTIVVTAPVARVVVDGPGWTCTTELRCRTEAPVPAGGSLPRLTVRWRVTPQDAERAPTARLFAAAPAGTSAVASGGTSSTAIPAGREGPDLVATVDGARPMIGRETAALRTVVRNAGTRATRLGVSVVLAAADQDGEDSSGPGWVCGGRSCSHEGPVAPGESLPPITTRQEIPAHGDGFDREAGVDLTPMDAEDDSDRTNDSAHADAQTAGAPADLAAAIEDVRAPTGQDGATGLVVIRNVGTATTDGEIVVRSRSRLSGDGWTCGVVCRHPGPVAPGGRLPDLRAEVPQPGDRDGAYEANTGSVNAEVENRSDGRADNDRASAEVPDGTGDGMRTLRVRLDPSRPASTDGVATVSGAVLAVRPGTAPVRFRVVPSPGVTAQALWLTNSPECESPSSCLSPTLPTGGSELRFGAEVRLADGVPESDVRLEATTNDPGALAAVVEARVRRPAEMPDVALQLDDARPSPFADRGETVVATVRNGGGPTDSPVLLTLPKPYVSGAAGPDWGCDARDEYVVSCRYDLPVRGGAELPPVTVRTNPVYRDRELTGSVAVDEDAAGATGTATLSTAAPDPSGPGLVVAVDPVDPEGTDAAAFDVLVRNADDATTTEPVRVRIREGTTAGTTVDRDASPGWTCGSSGCVQAGRLEAGSTAPALRLRLPSTEQPASSPFADGRAVLIAEAGASSDAWSSSLARRGSMADLRLGTVGARSEDGTPRVDVRVVNLGSEPTSGPVEVTTTTANGYVQPTAGDGSGWVCPAGGSVCRLGRALLAGERAPVLHVRPPSSPDDESSRTTVAARTFAAPGAPGERASGMATVTLDPPGVAADLAVDVDAPDALRVGERGTVSATVRNAGALPSAARVTLRLAWDGVPSSAPAVLSFSGDGWSCAPGLRPECTHDGPIPGGGSLPPVSAQVGPPEGYFGAVPRMDLSATVNQFEPHDAHPGNDTATTSVGVGGGPGRLVATVHGARPLLAGEAFALRTTVRNIETAPVLGPVELRFTKAPPGAVAGGLGWICDALVCRHPGPVLPGQDLPDVELRGVAPARGALDVRTTLSPGTVNDQQYLGTFLTTGETPRSADLVPSLAVAEPAVPGHDWVTLLHLTNRGTKRASGSVVATLDGDDSHGYGPILLPVGTTASGDGWACVALRCTTTADAAPGAVLPPLRVAVPVPPGETGVVLRARTTSDGADGRVDAVQIRTGATGPTAEATDRRSRVFSLGTASDRARPGERVAVQVPIAGLEPLADRDAVLRVDLPGALRFAGAAAGSAAPTVDGGHLEWRLRTPADGDGRLVTFWATVSSEAAPGPKPLSGELEVEGTASPERHSSDLAVVDPRIDAVDADAVTHDAPFRVAIEGALLRDDDRYELVRGDVALRGRETDGDDRRMSTEFDAADAPAGLYDLVVQTTSGQVLRRPDAVRVPSQSAGTGTPTTGSGPVETGSGADPADAGSGHEPVDAGTGPTVATSTGDAARVANDDIANLLAALIGSRRTPPAGVPTTTPTSRPLASPTGVVHPPRLSSLLRSGWRLSVRSTATTAVRVQVVADRSTARRLGIRAGSVLARASTTTGARSAVRSLRLRVVPAIRARLARQSRVTGTLRFRAVSAGGERVVDRAVVLRR